MGSFSPVALPTFAKAVLCIFLVIVQTTAWPSGIRNSTVCSDLQVTQALQVTNALQSREVGKGHVSLVLLKNGEEVQCYKPNQYYEGSWKRDSVFTCVSM